MAEPLRASFRSGGVDCAGYLYRAAAEGAETTPCVVLCHGFGGTQDTPAIRAAARAFANAGFAALTFDYRNFGESGGVPRQLIRIRDQHEDIRAAVAFARGRAEV